MKKYISLLFTLLFAAVLPAAAQLPLYIVNGKPSEEIASIPPDNIEQIEELPADEQTIARYGEKAAHGVLLITLRYDRPAQFPADSLSFGNYIARRVVWAADEPAARIAVRYKIDTTGQLHIEELLESTDSRLRRRVLKAVAEAPAWLPAQKKGSPVASEGVLRLQLPEGKRMPRQVELVIR